MGTATLENENGRMVCDVSFDKLEKLKSHGGFTQFDQVYRKGKEYKLMNIIFDEDEVLGEIAKVSAPSSLLTVALENLSLEPPSPRVPATRASTKATGSC